MTDSGPQMTMKDIAQAMGVSVATVSRALKDSPSISRASRERIQAFAREHHFFPNAIAEQLRASGKAPIKLIGVILPEVVHFYFASILNGIEGEARSRGYHIEVAISHEDGTLEREICKKFMRRNVCGVIVSQAKGTTDYKHFVTMAAQGMPMVFYDRICPAIDSNRVVVDDYKGSLGAVEHMIARGSRRIAFLGTAPNLQINKNRLNGYRDAHYKHGLTPDESLVYTCDTREAALELAPQLLGGSDRPDGIFAVNDETAIGMLQAAKEMSIGIPDELQICGFANSLQTKASDPQLTSIDQDGEQMGREAVDMLIGLVEGTLPHDHAQKRIVRTKLVVRGTTR